MVKRRLKIGALVLIVAGLAFSFGYLIPHHLKAAETENLTPIGGVEEGSEAGGGPHPGETTQPSTTTEASEGQETGPPPGTTVVTIPDVSRFLVIVGIFAALGIGGGIGLGYLIARHRVFAGVRSPPPKKIPKVSVEEQVFAYLRGRREFTIPELVWGTDATEAQVWRVVRKLIRRGIVRPTDRTRLTKVGPGKEEPNRIYEYVGTQSQ
jgi:hypothetical protein